MDDAGATLHVSFGREPFAALAAGFAEKSWYSRQSLLPDGFARHITESEPLLELYTIGKIVTETCRACAFARELAALARREDDASQAVV